MLCNIAVGMNLGELLYSIKRKGIPHLFVFNKSYSIFVSDVNKASVADYRLPALNIGLHGMHNLEQSLLNSILYYLFQWRSLSASTCVHNQSARTVVFKVSFTIFVHFMYYINCISRKCYRMTGRNSNKKGFLKVDFFPLCL